MAISPSTLFHFTGKKENLFGILQDNFKIKYCLEEISHSEKPVEIAVPMVSFCDIKISEITDHITKYGEYGLGLSKKWAVEKGLNPVLYLNTSSPFSNDFIKAIRKFNLSPDISNTDKYSLSEFIRYVKNYDGKLRKGEEILDNYRFADEREWRFVPILNASKDKPSPFYLKSAHKEIEDKKKHNDMINDLRLEFTPEDILYIVVSKEDEISELISHIRNVKGKNFTLSEVERLTSRIISCERIFNDF